MKSTRYFSFLVVLFLLVCYSTSGAQTIWNQLGGDMDGEASGDRSGHSVSMPDAFTVAIGAPWNAGNDIESGQVRVYKWNGSAWIPKGGDIDGEDFGSQGGYSLSMPDPNTLAIGAHYNGGNGFNSGQVRVYEWSGISWSQKGSDIDGEAAYDNSGRTVSMPDANTVAIGAWKNDGASPDAGHIRIFSWNGNAWIQKGADIDGIASSDWFGYTVSMPDSNTVAASGILNDNNGTEAGHVRVFAWDGNTWQQKGGDIEGEPYEQIGTSLSMPDAQTVAVGAPTTTGVNGGQTGQIKVFEWNGSSWVQKGATIEGADSGNHFGESISMPNANTIAVGAPGNNGNGTSSGHVRVYNWIGNMWAQIGSDIEGESVLDGSGWSVSMPDDHTVAIGARGNSDNGNNAGHVRVYSYSTATSIERNLYPQVILSYPNPTTGKLNIDLNSTMEDIKLIVGNSIGQELLIRRFSSASKIDIEIPGESGIYFVQIFCGYERIFSERIIKE